MLADAAAEESGADTDFLVQLAVQYVETKHKCSLDRRYKLPKLAYKSSDATDPKAVAKQRVRDTTKQPTITEVSSKAEPAGGKAGAGKGAGLARKAKAAPEATKLPVELFLVDSSGEESAAPGDGDEEEKDERLRLPLVRRNDVDDVDGLPRSMVVRFGPLSQHATDAITGAAGWALDCSCFGVSLTVPGHVPCTAVLPFAGVDGEATATLDPHGRVLEVKAYLVARLVARLENLESECLHV